MAEALELLIQGGAVGIALAALGILAWMVRHLMERTAVVVDRNTEAMHAIREVLVRHGTAIENHTNAHERRGR